MVVGDNDVKIINATFILRFDYALLISYDTITDNLKGEDEAPGWA